MMEYANPVSPSGPLGTAATPTLLHGALGTAESKTTVPKWTMVGVANASPACAAPGLRGKLATRAITTNCNPIRAPADEPTIT
jgi:hypothetical protein